MSNTRSDAPSSGTGNRVDHPVLISERADFLLLTAVVGLLSLASAAIVIP
ncbi:hypothetical protein [Natronocalculus amylovorans]|uniref:Uncharacterized protein n=1 Tax=Natronocalculus amylovorans TaxID=2917812 RepID=A0AAE3K814_9EURY|nr:hypothetical protein [Natronocalculus amylovorans]MCL9816837.1 hypothetical protein [Natronocalculus amylovorans]NUE01278.1 hypothetical protein [Halorubraceae archaeon YAN]